jgi:methylated-DNA-[protein]-cysteine S-methyltransferase
VVNLVSATLGSPVGPLSVACSDVGVARVSFGRPPEHSPERTPPEHSSQAPGLTGRGSLATAALDQLAGYFGGQRRAFDLPLDWSTVSPTQQQVLSALFDTVGFGETITYGSLARRAGLTHSGLDLPARAVGTIMGSNPWPLIVPCHRVVASDGLGGYSGGTGIEIKRWLLIFEGALPPTLDWDPAGPAAAASLS